MSVDEVTLQVNGGAHTLTAEQGTPLLYLLRNDLGLMGAKFGCGLGSCGTCTVLLDGQPVHACDTPLWSVTGREVTTLEGLTAQGRARAVQEAFLAEQAAQCGYCTAGLVVRAVAALEQDPDLDETGVRRALSGNLCRCGAHNRVVRAVLAAAGRTAGAVEREATGMEAEALGGDEPSPASPSLAANPTVARWLHLDPDGVVEVRSGKVDLGQGVSTALAQIAADELDVTPERIRMVRPTTDDSPDEGYTAGSHSIQHSGAALRAACATARALLLATAAGRLGFPPERLRVEDGRVSAPDGASVTYWELSGAVDLDVPVAGDLEGKAPSALRYTGRPLPRLDLPDKVRGRPRFLHDLRLPGQLFGRVLRPPARRATLKSFDAPAVRSRPDVVAVVHDGSFVGVVATREEAAVAALEAARAVCTWEEEDSLPAAGDLTVAPATERVLVGPAGPVGPPGGAHQLRGVFTRPYLAHASLAPSAATARWEGRALQVWTHSQGIFPLRQELARTFGLDPDTVGVSHVEGAGCYGHNGADDVALDAALLARAVPGRPVQVVWSREDELSWSPMGPAMVVQIDADVDEGGAVVGWRHQIWGNGFSGRPGGERRPPLLAATHLAHPRPSLPSGDPGLEGGGGAGRNSVPLYRVAGLDVRTHVLDEMPLRTSALRSLGAHLNVFAIEAMIDECARSSGRDPLEYRLGLLDDRRARDVLIAAADAAGWGRPLEGEGVGRGLGFARYKNVSGYCAVVAEVEAVTELRVRRLTLAVDVGRVVNRDGLANQVEGGAVQALSWTTKERVTFDSRRVTSGSWEGYPIATFEDVPPVEVVVLDRPAAPSLGAGEVSVGPTAAALGNALRDALGVRVGQLPLTTEQITAAILAA